MRILLALVSSVLLATPAMAQETPQPLPGETLVDRVIAVVGDTVLLLSDLQADVQQLQASGREIPTDPAERSAFIEDLLETRVNDLVVLEAAREAGIEVRDEEISTMVDQDIQTVQARFGSEAALVEALSASGMTLASYREMLAAQYRGRTLSQRFIQQRLASAARPAISEDEIREFFEAQREALGTRPATVSFRQVIVSPEPTDSAMAEARDTADSVLRQLIDGGDFAVLARRYSDDPGTREHGGDLGWFKRGRMVKEFEEVAFALAPGQTSPVVETDFGFHIIRVEKVRGGERQARHILISPEVTPADVERARAEADSLVAAIRAGASVSDLATRYETPPSEAEVLQVPVDQMPAPYNVELSGVQPDSVVGPFEIPGASVPSFAVVKVTDRKEAGAYTLDDLREQIRTRLQQQKMVEALTDELRRGMYVAVRG
ncbi:MAG TPA: peptidylprolyl isomerase [Longimicrobiaceae bacterium]|nr:peptidylprolyl isomerase [Longimicrobiaceae bacterium]